MELLTRTCNRCQEEKGIDDFYEGKYSCKSCCREYYRQYYRDKGQPPYHSEAHRRRRYKMPAEEFQRRMEEQDSRCAACGVAFSDDNIHVDHDHRCCPGKTSCGKCTRGLLCRGCNLALGHARDSEDVLMGLLNYIRGVRDG